MCYFAFEPLSQLWKIHLAIPPCASGRTRLTMSASKTVHAWWFSRVPKYSNECDHKNSKQDKRPQNKLFVSFSYLLSGSLSLPVSFLLLKIRGKQKKEIMHLSSSVPPSSHPHTKNKFVWRSSSCLFLVDAALSTENREIAGRSLVSELIVGKSSLP